MQSELFGTRTSGVTSLPRLGRNGCIEMSKGTEPLAKRIKLDTSLDTGILREDFRPLGLVGR
jgi:hypothetical protein